MSTNGDKLYADLSEHAQKQIDRAWKAYAILAGLLGVGALCIFGNLNDFKRDVRSDYQLEAQTAQAKLEQAVNRAFAAENIQLTIAKAVDNKLPAVVDYALSNRIAGLKGELAGLENKIKDMNARAVVAVGSNGVYKLAVGTNGLGWNMYCP